MKRIIFILIIFCFTQIESQTMFQKEVGTIYSDMGHNSDVGWKILKTADGGYITLSLIVGDSNFNYVFKSDKYGNLIWSKAITCGIKNQPYSICHCKNGGYIITGDISCSYTSWYDLSLIKLDENGNVLWSKYLKDNLPPSSNKNHDVGRSIIELDDESLIIAGYTDSYGAGQSDILLIKTNPNGNILWNKTYGMLGMDECYSLSQLNDKGFILSGACAKDGLGDGDSFLMRTDSLGNVIWAKSYGKTLNEVDGSAKPTRDNGYIITGRGITDSNGWDTFLIKTDSAGNLTWAKYYGGIYFEAGEDVIQVSDGNYVFTGRTGSLGNPAGDAFLIKTDTLGSIIFNKSYRVNDINFGTNVQQTNDGFVITGAELFYAFPSPGHVFFIKTDNNGNSGCNESDSVITTTPYTLTVTPLTLSVSTPTYSLHNSNLYIANVGTVTSLCSNVGLKEFNYENNNVIVFPNPSKMEFSFKNIESGSKIEIFDSFGKMVFNFVAKSNENVVNFKEKGDGIYFYKVTTSSKMIRRGKIILFK